MKTLSCLFVLYLTIFSPLAHAYIDPGSGSFLIQMLIASCIGAGLTFKMYYRNVKAKVKSLFGHKDTPSADEPEKP